MGFLQGSNTFAAGKIKLGSTDIDKIYFGSTEAWPATAPPPAVGDIVFTIDTRNTSAGSTASNQFKLPTYNGGGYDFTVDWGDANSNVVTTHGNFQSQHTYATEGIYTITCSAYQNPDPIYRGFTFNAGIATSNDKEKILSFTQWGALDLAGATDNGLGQYFWNCTNLDLSTVTDILNLSNVNTLDIAFSNTNTASINRVNEWDVSTVTDFSSCFSGSEFNDNLNLWNVSNGTNFAAMFRLNLAFNKDIGDWDTLSVTDMSFMFDQATAFNQDLSGWCVTNITVAPANFDTGATAWTLPKPVWGTCPGAAFSGGFFDGVYYNLVTSPTTGRTWLDRNLGASQIATSPTDSNSYGWYFQWGRKADGHQLQTSTSTFGTQTRATDPEVTTNQIYWSLGSPYDWDATQNTTRWQVGGINNPCPPGFRLPTIEELLAEAAAWSSYNDAFNGFLKLPTAGTRADAGNFAFQGERGYISSATEYQLSYSNQLFWSASGSGNTSGNNARSLFPVRPIKI